MDLRFYFLRGLPVRNRTTGTQLSNYTHPKGKTFHSLKSVH